MGTQMALDGRPLPRPNPTTQPFFDAAEEGRLDLQRCPRDGFFFYPRSRCPECLADDWAWETVSGRGEIAAVTVDRLGHDPALAADVPYVVAIVSLEEGPRMPARIVDCEDQELRVGLAVEACFEAIDGVTLVRFRPRSGD
jgi:uncharacterized OB-fold protein